VNRITLFVFHGAEIIYRLAENIEHAAEHAAAYWNGNRLAEIKRFHAAHQTFGRLHRDAADAPFAKVLGYFGDDIQRLRIVKTFAGDPHGVVNERKMALFKLDIDDGPDHFYYVSSFLFVRCHVDRSPSESVSNDEPFAIRAPTPVTTLPTLLRLRFR
jgi:hypothetical protein